MLGDGHCLALRPVVVTSPPSAEALLLEVATPRLASRLLALLHAESPTRRTLWWGEEKKKGMKDEPCDTTELVTHPHMFKEQQTLLLQENSLHYFQAVQLVVARLH